MNGDGYPIRVQRRRCRGYRLPPNTSSVTRPGPFGNPFRVGQAGIESSDQAVAAFEAWLNGDGRHVVELARHRLVGKNLACYCPLTRRCHADVLLRVANERPADVSAVK